MPSLSLTPELKRHLESAQKTPLSSTKHALQIVAVQLRAWLADENDVACRPWYIFCVELYPRGKIINQKMHRPASQTPPPSALFSFLLTHIHSPPEGELARRPTHVSFVHQPITDLLLPHLACLKINTGTLTLADGVSEFVKKYSEKIISIDRGTRGDAAERPGLLSVPSITPPVAGDLMAAAVAMYEAQPWRGIPEHLALEIRLPEDNDAYRRRYYATVLGSDEKVYGIALVASLKNLRDKYCRAMLGKMSDSDESDDETVPIIRETRMGDDDIFLCACCGKRVGETVSDDGGRYVERCVGCQRLLYCNQTCQKLDWRERHREECNEAKTNEEYVFKREKWAWLRREVALLFLDPTAIPFDDLDAYEEHGWRYVDASPTLHAMPFVTVQGSTSMSNRMDRPTLQEIIDLTLITKALTECVSPPPTEGILHLASGVSIAVAENLADSSRR